jgi:hypothetical protein
MSDGEESGKIQNERRDLHPFCYTQSYHLERARVRLYRAIACVGCTILRCTVHDDDNDNDHYAPPLRTTERGSQNRNGRSRRRTVVARSTWAHTYCCNDDAVPFPDLGGDCTTARLVSNVSRGASIGQWRQGYLWQSF